jgi:hypothetical protein
MADFDMDFDREDEDVDNVSDINQKGGRRGTHEDDFAADDEGVMPEGTDDTIDDDI